MLAEPANLWWRITDEAARRQQRQRHLELAPSSLSNSILLKTCYILTLLKIKKLNRAFLLKILPHFPCAIGLNLPFNSILPHFPCAIGLNLPFNSILPQNPGLLTFVHERKPNPSCCIQSLQLLKVLKETRNKKIFFSKFFSHS
jgi:hypothetical protein